MAEEISTALLEKDGNAAGATQSSVDYDDEKKDNRERLTSAPLDVDKVLATIPRPRVDSNSIKAEVTTLVSWVYIVTGFFGFIAVSSLILMIITFAGVANKIETIFVIIAVEWLGAFMGAYLVYRFGTLQTEIDRLRGETDEYTEEIAKLRMDKQTLSQDVKRCQGSINQCQREANELDEAIEGFSQLEKDLQSIAGDSEEVGDVISSIQNLMGDIQDSAESNERAAIMSTFYDVCFRSYGGGTGAGKAGGDGHGPHGEDDSATMNRKEYNRFLGRLSKSTRAMWEHMCDFDEVAGDNGLICIHEFERILTKFLERNRIRIARESFTIDKFKKQQKESRRRH